MGAPGTDLSSLLSVALKTEGQARVWICALNGERASDAFSKAGSFSGCQGHRNESGIVSALKKLMV